MTLPALMYRGVAVWLLALLGSRCAGLTTPCYPRDCHDLQCLKLTGPATSTISLPNGVGNTLTVRCDFDTDGGGWTVFQRRQDGSVDFQQPWQRYKVAIFDFPAVGFGNDREFWLGNDYIHRLTKGRKMSLRIDMQRVNNNRDYVVYGNFRVDSERFNYSLMVGRMTGYKSHGGDMLGFLRRMPFSTYDHDNSPGRCAVSFRSGWWYKNCVTASMNGLWRGNVTFNESAIGDNHGMMWKPFDIEPHLKACAMKFRPMSTSCQIPCPNGGTCEHVGENRYRCLCLPSYTGEACETLLPCLYIECKNGGTQVVDDDICYCKCTRRFLGKSCELRAYTVGPAATFAPNETRRPLTDDSPAPPGLLRRLQQMLDIFTIGYICGGILVFVLVIAFVWSLVEAVQLRKRAIKEGFFSVPSEPPSPKRNSIEEAGSEHSLGSGTTGVTEKLSLK